METLLSPGSLLSENDLSQVPDLPIQAGAALIGPTVLGKPNIPKLVTNYPEYLAHFGSTLSSGSAQYSYFTSISAYNYFQNGGSSLLVTRVAPSGSEDWEPAVSTFVDFSGSLATSAFELETISPGVIMNSSGSEDSKGVLENGTSDNLRWEIANRNENKGTFSLIIRRGDDSTKNKLILEVFNNLSLDPKANNFISKIIGDQVHSVESEGDEYYVVSEGLYNNKSKYLRVKSVNNTTPDYFDGNGVAKTAYKSLIPLNQSGSFSGGVGELPALINFYEDITDSNSQGLTATDYSIAVNILSNPTEYVFNVISIPGLVYEGANHQTILDSLILNTEQNGMNISIIDLAHYGARVNEVKDISVNIDSSYTATYWPWVQVQEPNLGQLVWVPASTILPGVYAYNDEVGEAWFSPAGFNRGGLSIVTQAERKLKQSQKDILYENKINPLATFPGKGVVVLGNKTLQTKASALDRVNVRRLLIELKTYIKEVSNSLLFEPNTLATRNSFLSQINPYLSSVQQRQGLYAFKVVMDETNNTPATIDRQELRGAIYIQPVRTSEFIYLDFNIYPTGVEFPA